MDFDEANEIVYRIRRMGQSVQAMEEAMRHLAIVSGTSARAVGRFVDAIGNLPRRPYLIDVVAPVEQAHVSASWWLTFASELRSRTASRIVPSGR